MRYMIIIFPVIIVLLSTSLTGCTERRSDLAKEIISMIEGDCNDLLSNLDIEIHEGCHIFVSEEIVPLEIAVFGNQVTSLDYFRNIDKEVVFDSLVMMDLRNGDEVLMDQSIRSGDKGRKYNLKAYLSNTKDVLITCEIVPYEKSEKDILYAQKVMFSTSILYLFELDEHNRVKNWIKRVIHNN